MREGGIDCDLTLDGGLEIALSAAQMARSRGGRRRARATRDGRPRHPLDADQARAACGSPRALGGVVLKTAGGVQPALLALGLRRLAVERGVQVFEASPMTRLRRGDPAVVETPPAASRPQSGPRGRRLVAQVPSCAAPCS